MNILVTGGAGFIGRWLIKRLLDEKNQVIAIDDLSNGRLENISEFRKNRKFKFLQGDIRNSNLIKKTFDYTYDAVYHLAAEINIQKSLDDPLQTFQKDVIGTFNILDECRKRMIKMIFMSSCMVYTQSQELKGISETHSIKATSPYAAAKLSGEFLTLSYYHSYDLPTVVLRPFNTYGPYQKTTGEGGVVAIFSEKSITNQPLLIYGTGEQTRDLLFVEDCVDFILRAGSTEKAKGEVFNAGTGKDVSINQLATYFVDNLDRIQHIKHIHAQSEIMKLQCDYTKSRNFLNWKPTTSLAEGIKITKNWIAEQIRS